MSTCAENIEFQKEMAASLLKQISRVDPYCILVGGAPRDWYFNQEATDLDFFFVPNKETSIEDVMSSLDIVIIRHLGTADHHLCKQMPGPLKIWEGGFKNIKIQLVEIASKEIMSIAVDQLHLSISKICWTLEGGFQMHEDFSSTLKTKIIYGKNGYDLNSHYAQKVLGKYKHLGYTLGESVR